MSHLLIRSLLPEWMLCCNNSDIVFWDMVWRFSLKMDKGIVIMIACLCWWCPSCICLSETQWLLFNPKSLKPYHTGTSQMLARMYLIVQVLIDFCEQWARCSRSKILLDASHETVFIRGWWVLGRKYDERTVQGSVRNWLVHSICCFYLKAVAMLLLFNPVSAQSSRASSQAHIEEEDDLVGMEVGACEEIPIAHGTDIMCQEDNDDECLAEKELVRTLIWSLPNANIHMSFAGFPNSLSCYELVPLVVQEATTFSGVQECHKGHGQEFFEEIDLLSCANNQLCGNYFPH